jgi:citrate lyase subunit beta/citryl-CoA lyase
MQQDWEIKGRSHACTRTGKTFEEGEFFYTLLFRDEAGFRRECEEADRDGFTAKMAIHPAQVPVINEVFTPSAEALAQARGVVAAFRDAGDAGVVAIGGKMYDRPHLRLAERLLARASKA